MMALVPLQAKGKLFDCQRGQSAEVKLQCSFILGWPLVISSSPASRECKPMGNEEGQGGITSNSTLKDFTASNCKPHNRTELLHVDIIGDWSVPRTKVTLSVPIWTTMTE